MREYIEQQMQNLEDNYIKKQAREFYHGIRKEKNQ